MAKFMIDNTEYDVLDGTPLAEICEKAGVPFNCNSGVCGACQVKVLEGAENLNELSPEEKDLGLDSRHRLSCQLAIKSGLVRVTY